MSTKLERCLEAELAWIAKRIPGRKSTDALDRISALLTGSGDGEDAQILTDLAVRLRELRNRVRGPGSREHTAVATAQQVADAVATLPDTPFTIPGEVV